MTTRFGGLVAVDGIDFAVAPGETFGFLGPNGAGKTSTMRMIGAVSPQSGRELTPLCCPLGGFGLHLWQQETPGLRGLLSSDHSPGWTRTSNPPVNSRMLCQLSYRGPVADAAGPV